MNDELQKLALELVACERFEPMGGMLFKARGLPWYYAKRGERIRIENLDRRRVWNVLNEDSGNGHNLQRYRIVRMALQLDDPATVGCLLAMLWEVWPEANLTPLVRLIRDVTGWVIYLYADDGTTYPATQPQQTPGEAIARALLQAWGTP